MTLSAPSSLPDRPTGLRRGDVTPKRHPVYDVIVRGRLLSANARPMTSETMTYHRARRRLVRSAPPPLPRSRGERPAAIPRGDFLVAVDFDPPPRSLSLFLFGALPPSPRCFLLLPPPPSEALSLRREKRPRFTHYACNWARCVHVSNVCDGVSAVRRRMYTCAYMCTCDMKFLSALSFRIICAFVERETERERAKITINAVVGSLSSAVLFSVHFFCDN